MMIRGLYWDIWRRSEMIGCSVVRGELRMLQVLESRSGSLSLRCAATTLPKAPDGKPIYTRRDLSEAIRCAWSNGRFTGRNLVATLPDTQMIYRRIQLAPMPKEEIIAAVHWKLASELGQPADAICTDCYALGAVDDDSSSPRTVLACAATYEDVEILGGAIVDAGLNPLSIDTSLGAIARCIGRGTNATIEAEWSFVVLIGSESVTLQIIEGQQPSFVRVIPGGHDRLIQRVRASVDLCSSNEEGIRRLFESEWNDPSMPHVEANEALRLAATQACRLYARELEPELRRCSQYLGDMSASSRILCGCIMGVGPWESLIGEALSRSTGIPFVAWDELLDPQIRRLVRENALTNEWIVPLGLGMDVAQNITKRGRHESCQSAV